PAAASSSSPVHFRGSHPDACHCGSVFRVQGAVHLDATARDDPRAHAYHELGRPSSHHHRRQGRQGQQQLGRPGHQLQVRQRQGQVLPLPLRLRRARRRLPGHRWLDRRPKGAQVLGRRCLHQLHRDGRQRGLHSWLLLL
ncbi:hypothetical protein BN1708_017813, partial [Verticillium longisporum]